MFKRSTAMTLLLCFFASTVLVLAKKPPAKKKPAPPRNVDITKQAREWSSKKYAAPPTQFRRGHVKPKTFPAKAIQQTKTGFAVQLPSRAPIAAGGYLFLATLNGDLLQLEQKRGKIVKSWKINAPIRQQPIIMHGRIFVGTANGKIIMLDTKNPKLTGWSAWGGNSAHTGVIDENASK